MKNDWYKRTYRGNVSKFPRQPADSDISHPNLYLRPPNASRAFTRAQSSKRWCVKRRREKVAKWSNMYSETGISIEAQQKGRKRDDVN